MTCKLAGLLVVECKLTELLVVSLLQACGAFGSGPQACCKLTVKSHASSAILILVRKLVTSLSQACRKLKFL